MEKLGIWVFQIIDLLLALIKAVSPGRLMPWWLVRHMDPGLYYLLVCDLWADYFCFLDLYGGSK